MATRERQPPPAQSKTTPIYNTVLSPYIKVPYPNIIQVILWRFKIIKLKKSAWFPAIWWGRVGICLQECGHTKEGGWGEWQVDMNVPSPNSFWKVGHDMPLLVFNPSLSFAAILSRLMSQFQGHVAKLKNKPLFGKWACAPPLNRWLDARVVNCQLPPNQIIACSNRAGSIN